jgi:hypothetical protein
LAQEIYMIHSFRPLPSKQTAVTQKPLPLATNKFPAPSALIGSKEKSKIQVPTVVKNRQDISTSKLSLVQKGEIRAAQNTKNMFPARKHLEIREREKHRPSSSSGYSLARIKKESYDRVQMPKQRYAIHQGIPNDYNARF